MTKYANYPKWPSGNGVQNAKNALKTHDEAMGAMTCCDCGEVFTYKELVPYKGYRCRKCIHPFIQGEYDITPTDKTARFLIKMGSASMYWRNATNEQRAYTKQYCIDHEITKETLKQTITAEPEKKELFEDVIKFNNLEAF